MADRIFISYRRDDSAGHAGRVFDRLQADFGQDVLFMDVDAIPLGANFVRVLREEVAKCSALLAIIGPNWLNARDEDGARRLDNPNDFVRVEISAALQRDIPVIPILLEGARIPKTQALPDDLKELSERNGLDVRHASFHADMDKLVRGLRAASKASSRPVPAHPAPAAQAPFTRSIRAFGDLPGAIMPTVDDVIAAKGRWVKEFGIDPHVEAPPEVFGHLFVRPEILTDRDDMAPGTIVTGRRWDRSTSPYWNVVHGYTDHTGYACCHLDALTYLGPAWRPEFAQLSDALFRKFGGTRLGRFIK